MDHRAFGRFIGGRTVVFAETKAARKSEKGETDEADRSVRGSFAGVKRGFEKAGCYQSETLCVLPDRCGAFVSVARVSASRSRMYHAGTVATTAVVRGTNGRFENEHHAVSSTV